MKKLIAKIVLAASIIAPLAFALPAHAVAPPNWNITGTWNLNFEIGGGHYLHTMDVASFNLTTGEFSGTGVWNDNPAAYTWTVTGTVSENNIRFHIIYTGTGNPGYTVDATGVIASATSMNGTWGGGTWTGTGIATTIIPTDKNQCKNGGWQNLRNDKGMSFKNQGDCVSFVASKGKAQGNPVPTLRAATITSNGLPIGDLTGATLVTSNSGSCNGSNSNTAACYILNVSNVVVSNGPLPVENAGFKLQATSEQKTILTSYFAAKGWPSNYLDQIKLEIDGTAPFFYFVSDGSSGYSLADGFQWGLGQQNKPLVIDDNYPAGVYTFMGAVNGNPVTVTLTVTKAIKTFTATDSSNYNGPSSSDPLYGTGPISFTWDTATGNVTGGYYNEVAPPSIGPTYFNTITAGNVSSSGVVSLTFSRTLPSPYGFTFAGTLSGGTLTGQLDGPYLFTATGTITP